MLMPFSTGLQGAEAVRARFLYNEAVGLKQAIQHDINALKEQAATPLM